MKDVYRPDEGFTVIELLITIIMIGSIFGAFVTTFTALNNIVQKGKLNNLATANAFSKLQEYENKNFANIPTTTPTSTYQEVEDFSPSLPTTLPGTRVGKVYISTISPTLKLVIVRVFYDSAENPKILEYSDLIQQDGVGR